MKIYTYIKYPVKKDFLESCKITMFTLCGRIEKSKSSNLITVFSETSLNDKGQVVYSEENKICFYCKSMLPSDIIKFKGGFHIEKCDIEDRIRQARKWYFSTNQKLPRKIKKQLIGKS